MPHEHCEHHHHHTSDNQKSLLVVLCITAFYMAAEFVGGYFTNSLALMADAGHMLGDVAALGLSFFAIWLSSKKAPPEKTYGYYRAEILAALINGVTLIFIAFAIIREAYHRMTALQNIDAPLMVIIAAGGLIVNIIGAWMLHKGSKENLNIKGAFLHVIGDLLGSVGAIIAGVLVWKWQFYIADPIVSVFIAVLVLYSSISLTKSAVNILMEAAPKHVNIREIQDSIAGIKDVADVYDLHVWSISSNRLSLSVHVAAKIEDYEIILCEINEMLKEKFGIEHSTIQIEPKDFRKTVCPFS
jgi:cobalt-zinc-cadmium efflux system protein